MLACVRVAGAGLERPGAAEVPGLGLAEADATAGFESNVILAIADWLQELNRVPELKALVCAESQRDLGRSGDLCAAYSDVYDSSPTMALLLTTLSHFQLQLNDKKKECTPV